MKDVMIWVDFMKVDDERRLILTTRGTLNDFERHGITPSEGLVLTFYDGDLDERGERDDITVDGRLHFDPKEGHWVAIIDWKAIKHASGKLAFENRDLG